MRKHSCAYRVDGFNRGTSVTFNFVPSPSPKYLKGSVLHSLHILLAPERLTFTLIERLSLPSSLKNPQNKTKTVAKSFWSQKGGWFFFSLIIFRSFWYGLGNRIIITARRETFWKCSCAGLWWIWAVTLLWFIRAAAVIRAGGSETSLRAAKRSWLVPSSELSGMAEDPTWLHVRPHVAATYLWWK